MNGLSESHSHAFISGRFKSVGLRALTAAGFLYLLLVSSVCSAADPMPIAHRGLLRDAPENTLPAFAACLDLGFGFELDIRTTNDGELVVLHDDSLARTTNGGNRSIRDVSMAAAAQLDAGSWFDSAFANTRIPTLEQVLALVAERKTGPTIIALNVKQLTREGERKLVAVVEKYELLDDSFAFDQSDDVSRRLKELNPQFRIGQNVNRQSLEARLQEGLLDVFLLTYAPRPDEVVRLHSHGRQVLFNYGGAGEARRNEDTWKQARVAGIDGMLTDYPLECRRVWRSEDDEVPLRRILFGSCTKQDRPMPIFKTIVAQRPDLFVFLGDNIYGDTEDMAVLQAKYDKLGANPGFARLREISPVLATWDDHDYGVNDGGADYSQRVDSQRIFLDFWRDPVNSPRRQRPGVYGSHVSGPEGKRVQVILLDTRYFRSPLKKGERRVGGPYLPDDDPQKTMLGEAQWKWLADQLKVPAELRIIATSIQCVAQDAGQETWSNLPVERRRLLQLISASKASGVLFISGDRHWSELSVTNDRVPYPIYDLTSSSFNQLHERGTPTENRYRALPKTYHRENFGAIAVDWEQPDPAIRLEIRDLDGKVQLQKLLHLSELAAR